MKLIAALTPPTPETGYVPYVNASENDNGDVVLALREAGEAPQTLAVVFKKADFAAFVEEAHSMLKAE